jgi:thymidylate synthase
MGISTRIILGYQRRYDLNEGISLLTTKKVYFSSIIYELLWFLNLKGNTTIAYYKNMAFSYGTNELIQIEI